VRPRVLVVDDEAPQLEILRLILGSEGYDVVTAGSGRTALAALRGQPFEVVLTDLKMPDLSGIEVLKELQADGIRIPVVMVAGEGDEDSAVQAFKLGVADYLIKRDVSVQDFMYRERRVVRKERRLAHANPGIRCGHRPGVRGGPRPEPPRSPTGPEPAARFRRQNAVPGAGSRWLLKSFWR
jgi:DNA-binding NtrC family response regulator